MKRGKLLIAQFVASCITLTLLVGTLHPLRADETDDAIAKNRMGTISVEAAPGTKVKIEQQSHEFWFGAALSSGMFSDRTPQETRDKYKEVFLEKFNSAVTENAFKWRSMEYRQGEISYDTVDAILEWADENEIPVRGHCVYWGVPNFVHPWLKTMNDEELTKALKNRAMSGPGHYKGRFAEYDLNNEMVHSNYYEQRLGPDITKKMAQWVKEADPETPLFVNDYDILTGNRLDDYIRQIKSLREQGVPIEGIGVQGHLHGDTFEPQALKNALDELGKLNLKIRVTEFNMPGQRSKYYNKRDVELTPEEEKRKAENLVEYYRICFAHPAVDGILMWGFWEEANWIPCSSLYKKDWTPTPAAEAYQNLIHKQWWTSYEGTAGEDGKVEIPAFYGRYLITVGGEQCTFELKNPNAR